MINKALLSLLIILSLSQCILTKKQKDKFLAKYCERKDSFIYIRKDSIVVKDTTIYIPTIVNTPIYLENPCKELCDSLGKLKPFFKSQSKNGIKSTVKSVGNSIVLQCETDSLKARIQYLEHYITNIEKSYTENTVEKSCELEHRTKFDGFTWWWFWITASIIVLFVLVKKFKAYLNRF
jgi:hypothetical protein